MCVCQQECEQDMDCKVLKPCERQCVQGERLLESQLGYDSPMPCWLCNDKCSTPQGPLTSPY